MRLRHTRHIAVAVTMFASSAAARAQLVQPAAHTVLETGPDWVKGLAEPASGRFIVYADDNAIRIYNRRTKQTSSVAIKVSNAFGSVLTLSRSGHRLIFPREAERTGDAKRVQGYIWSLDLDTLTGAPIGEPHRVSLAPAINASISADGRWIALAANDKNAWGNASGQRLLVMPSDGGDERMLDSATLITTPRWSPDGKSIYYVRGVALMRATTDGKSRDSLAAISPGQRVADVSPDGNYIALASRDLLQEVRDTHGGVVARFSASDARVDSWSRTEPGSLLAFRLLEPATLKTLSLTNGTVTNFPISEKFPIQPVYSPNGLQLAMMSKAGDQSMLVVYEVRTRQRRVVNVPPGAGFPTWSPDAARIAFLATDPAVVLGRSLFVTELATGHTTKLIDVYRSTTFRWRADGKALDILQGKIATGRDLPEVHRVTLSGLRSIVRVLPQSDNDNNGPIRLISDSTVLVGMKDRLLAVPLPAGEPRAIFSGSWASPPNSALSPDGKWIATEAGGADGHSAQITLASPDGKSVRRLGLSKGCDVMPSQWLPDSRGLIAWGAERCNDWLEEPYVVPIDGSPAQPLALPANQSYTLTPDGKQLLLAVDDPKIGSIIAYDVSKFLARPVQAAKPGRP